MMLHIQLQRIGSLLQRHIARQYPFRSIEEAVFAFLDFVPIEHHAAYEEYQLDFIELFLQAYIRSSLEKHPKKSFRSIAPIVMRNALSDIKVALMNDDLPLHYNDRDTLIELITDSRRKFEEMLEDIAMAQATAKMLCVMISSQKRKAQKWYPYEWDQ